MFVFADDKLLDFFRRPVGIVCHDELIAIQLDFKGDNVDTGLLVAVLNDTDLYRVFYVVQHTIAVSAHFNDGARHIEENPVWLTVLAVVMEYQYRESPQFILQSDKLLKRRKDLAGVGLFAKETRESIIRKSTG